MHGTKGGDDYHHQKSREEYIDKGPPSLCKLCGEIGHQAIGCHYHPLILDDKRVSSFKS